MIGVDARASEAAAHADGTMSVDQRSVFIVMRDGVDR
jgi:hypothetical protein